MTTCGCSVLMDGQVVDSCLVPMSQVDGRIVRTVEGLAIAPGPEGWLELLVQGVRAYIGEVEIVPRTTLLLGDSISISRGGDPVLRVVST